MENIPVLEQLKWEEALLRVDQRHNWCLLNHGSPPAIVMGISGDFNQLVNRKKLEANPIPVIRRFSGGGTVVIDHQTIFATFIFNSNSLPIPPFPQPIMRWTESIYQPVFKGLPFSLKENDYVLTQEKIGGNAQSITKSRWLHHTSFLFDFNPHLMDLLLTPGKAPKYRNQRKHGDFLSCLRHYWDSIDGFKKDLIDSLQKKFAIHFVPLQELESIAGLPHRRTTRIEVWDSSKITV